MRETTDIAEIVAIACHPAVFPMFVGKGDRETWKPPNCVGIHWLVGDGVLMMFVQQRQGWWEVHIGALPEARNDVKRQALEGLEWASEYGCRYVTGVVRQDNQPGRNIALAVGMRMLFEFPGHVVFGKEIRPWAE